MGELGWFKGCKGRKMSFEEVRVDDGFRFVIFIFFIRWYWENLIE